MAKKKKAVVADDSDKETQKGKKKAKTKEPDLKEKVKEIIESPSELELDILESELVLGYRIRELKGLDTPIHIHALTSRIEAKADLAYAEEFNRLLQTTDLPSMAKLEKQLRTKGNWTDEDDLALNKAYDTYRETMMSLTREREGKKPDIDKIFEIQANIVQTRFELGNKIVERDSLFSATLERQAEQMRTKTRLLECIKTPGGDPFWKSLEELDNDSHILIVNEIIKEATMFWQGISPDFFGSLLDVLIGEPSGK